MAALASLRPGPGSTAGYATRIALRELGRPAQFPGTRLERLDELIVPLVTARAPGLLALYGIGPHTAALLLIAAGDHPQRLRSEAALAHLCAMERAASPDMPAGTSHPEAAIVVSSGQKCGDGEPGSFGERAVLEVSRQRREVPPGGARGRDRGPNARLPHAQSVEDFSALLTSAGER